MNIGEVIDKLTVSQSTVQEFYNEGYGHAEFKVKSTDIFADDLVKYFSEEVHSGKSLGWVKTEDKFRVRNELNILTGVSGHGKSMWLSQVVLSMMNLEEIRLRLVDANLKKVAEKAGIHEARVYRLMSGETEPMYETVKALSDYLEGKDRVDA